MFGAPLFVSTCAVGWFGFDAFVAFSRGLLFTCIRSAVWSFGVEDLEALVRLNCAIPEFKELL